MKEIRVGLLGLGQVGSGVWKILTGKNDALARRLGRKIVIPRILVKDPKAKQLVSAPKGILTADPLDVLRDPSIGVIIEVAGGIRPAESWYYEAFKNGKDVITANKALLAERGDEVFAAARKYGRKIFFEAAVGGGIPILKTLREGLVANRIESVAGIVNGTTNYILTEMSQKNMGFEEALKLAQAAGYAEADPTFDVKGIDAAHKLTILIRMALREAVSFNKLKVLGIDTIAQCDIEYAKRFGYTIKLIASAKLTPKGIFASVEPLLLRQGNMLAKVDGPFNAIMLKGDEVGDLMLYGRGAGTHPTASAVVNDLYDLLKGNEPWDYSWIERSGKLAVGGMASRYYLRFSVIDRPGVLAHIARLLGSAKVSIAEVIQPERKAGDTVPLIMATHMAEEACVDRAVRTIDRLSCVRAKSQKIRIED